MKRISPTTPAGPRRCETDIRTGPARSRPRLRILIVDDNEDAADMLSIQLVRGGHAVQVAYGGEAALRLCRADGCPGFDIALIDLGMPGMDGWTLARRLRGECGVETIVAITGYGSERARARSKEAGIDRHLVKPVSAADIERALELGESARSDDRPGALDLDARTG